MLITKASMLGTLLNLPSPYSNTAHQPWDIEIDTPYMYLMPCKIGWATQSWIFYKFYKN